VPIDFAPGTGRDFVRLLECCLGDLELATRGVNL
jgi:hypothetical protein